MNQLNELAQNTIIPSPSSWKMLTKQLTRIAICVGIGAGIGYGAASVQKPQWQAQAQFSVPNVSDLGNYYSLSSTYALLQGVAGESVAENVTTQAFAEFKYTLTSPNAIKLFLRQSDSVKIWAQASKTPIEEGVNLLAEKFQFNEKTNQLSVTLDNAEMANQLLSEFVIFATKQSREVLNSELVSKWKVLFQQVKAASESNLGAIQLGTQVAQQDWNGKLSLMKSVKPLDDKLIAYRLIESPTVPSTPHSPDKGLWAMIGGIAGLVCGLFGMSMTSFRRR